MELIISIYKWLKTTSEGRTLYRGTKTFMYSFIGIIGTTMAAGVSIDWKMSIGAAVVAAIGFSSDKGLREFKGVKLKKTKK